MRDVIVPEQRHVHLFFKALFYTLMLFVVTFTYARYFFSVFFLILGMSVVLLKYVEFRKERFEFEFHFPKCSPCRRSPLDISSLMQFSSQQNQRHVRKCKWSY